MRLGKTSEVTQTKEVKITVTLPFTAHRMRNSVLKRSGLAEETPGGQRCGRDLLGGVS
jgi:hypothetical protein